MSVREKTKRAFKHSIPLTCEQWELVIGVEKLMWRFANLVTPWELGRCEWAVEESYDCVRRCVIRAAHSYTGDVKFGSFAFTHVRRQAYDHWKKQKFVMSLESITCPKEKLVMRNAVVDPASIRPEPDAIDDDVCHALKKLCPRHYLAVALSNGLNDGIPRSGREIGRIMGCDERSARGLVISAIKRLRELLGVQMVERGVMCSELSVGRFACGGSGNDWSNGGNTNRK